MGSNPINKIQIKIARHNLYNYTKMNCEAGNLEAQMQMGVSFPLWSLFSEFLLQKRNQMFML